MASDRYGYTITFNTPQVSSGAVQEDGSRSETEPSTPRKEFLEEINSGFNLLAKVSTFLGGGFILLYAVQEGFLPALLASITIPMLVYLGALFTLVFGIGLAMGSCVSYWLFRLLVATRKNRKNDSTLLPITSWGRWILTIGSLIVFAFLAAIFSMTAIGRHDLSGFNIFLFFFVGGLLTLGFVDSTKEVSWRAAIAACLTPLVLLVALPQARTGVADLAMSVMRFRSSPGDTVIITDDGYQRLVEQSEAVGMRLHLCKLSAKKDGKWRFYDALVVWNSVGDLVFLKADRRRPASGPVFDLQRADITILNNVQQHSCSPS